MSFIGKILKEFKRFHFHQLGSFFKKNWFSSSSKKKVPIPLKDRIDGCELEVNLSEINSLFHF